LLNDTATNDPPKWRVAGRPSASKITKSSVLYQHLKGKAHDYSPTRLRTFKQVDTGARFIKEVSVRIKPWFWTGEKGETLLTVQYGSKQIELAKNKTAVEVGDFKNLCSVLDAVIAATRNGELDLQIETASAKLREGFKR